MCQLSIIVPTIRTHLLEDLYQSFCNACSRHSFEVVFIGPFDIPQSVLSKDNVAYIKDYGQPTIASQKGLVHATGKLVCWTTDDCWGYPDRLSDTIDIYNKECVSTDIIGLRFFENPEHYNAIKNKTTTDQNPSQRLYYHPDSYWYAGSSYPQYNVSIHKSWGSACHFMMNTQHIQEYGGWDCEFEYVNHACHDMLFRMQKYGSRFFLTDYDVYVLNWYQGTTKDHAPIHYGQTTHDEQLFHTMWSQPNNRYKISIDNWKNYPEIWQRRFGKDKPTQYRDLYECE